MAKKKKNIISRFSIKEAWAIIIFILSIPIFLSIITYDGHLPDGGVEFWLGEYLGFISYYIFVKTLGYFSTVFPIIMIMIAYSIFFRKNLSNYIKKSIHLFAIALACAALLYKLNYLIVGELGVLTGKFIIDRITGLFLFNLLMPFSIIILIASFFNVSLYDLLMITIEKFQPVLKLLTGLLSMIIKKIKLVISKFKNYKANKKLKIEVSKPEEIINKSGNQTEPMVDSHEGIKDNQINEEENNGDSLNDTSDKLNDDINMNQGIESNNNDISKSKENTSQNTTITIEDEVEVEQGDLDQHESRKSKYRNYKLPLTEYLINPVEISNAIDEEMLREKAQELIHALETFGVQSKVKKISPGPVITLFEIEPDEGVRVNKFTNLSDDLARVMAAQRIRVIAPIPGTKSVGIELPNSNPSIVYLKTIINSERYINSNSKLTIGLGKTTTGDAYTFDLAKMPHLLVAGATGSGKSVCINTIIISILYKAKPDEVKFILIDPKKLELATYKSLVGYHLITAPNLDEYVMTTADNAVGILNSAITEMERRFQVFSDARVRNISEYQARCVEDSQLENIPYIVVLIDELADLMMTTGRAIEDPVTRLAQKARAVGIHLVVATQRPSVDVITGLIKSNFPARISFQVSSQIDSRTILDQMGAEKLLGKGDMLFLLPGSVAPIRLHNAFIQLNEIEEIMSHISNQPQPEELHLPEITKISTEGNFHVNDDSNDELLYEAAKMVTDNQQASVSLLQRKFKIGYSRAGRLIDELESLGIISGHNGSKPRDVLVDNRYIDNIFNK